MFAAHLKKKTCYLNSSCRSIFNQYLSVQHILPDNFTAETN